MSWKFIQVSIHWGYFHGKLLLFYLGIHTRDNRTMKVYWMLQSTFIKGSMFATKSCIPHQYIYLYYSFCANSLSAFGLLCTTLNLCLILASTVEFFYNSSFSGKSWQNLASIDGEEQNITLPPVRIESKTSWLSCQCSTEWAESTFSCQSKSPWPL